VSANIDHLVVFAANLDEGVAWCEATLGMTPGPGGQHALMGTHNRLFKIATPDHPQAYFEIIAINFEANYQAWMPTFSMKNVKSPADWPQWNRTRWFDMDALELRQRVAKNGPQFVHWVAGVGAMDAALHALRAQGIDRGPALAASRMTPTGLLEWQISVRDDGQRLFSGALPTLIQWGAKHPSHTMPESGVTLQSLQVFHPEATALQAAFASIGLEHISVQTGPSNLVAHLQTPRGPITLQSAGF
jgi:catechol 2,3-dioxygenase-like lactoylglutathione lyase family enzyme